MAQLVRALPSHGRGHRFESCYAHARKCRDSVGLRLTGDPQGQRAGEERGLPGVRPVLQGNSAAMIELLLIVLLVVVLVGAFGGPRYYRGRRTTVVRERDVL
jgi:hypothetical protein